MTIQLQAPCADFDTLLGDYARDFDWYCFCLSCGHVPARGDDPLQSIYQAQARWRGHRMQELYPLVCAHWDVVNLATRLSASPTEPQQRPLLGLMRAAKARHRAALQVLRQSWHAAAGPD